MLKNLKERFSKYLQRINKENLNRLYPLFFTIAFIAIIGQYSFSGLESIFYDLRVKFDFYKPNLDQIVVVSLDEESDDFLGETYPYTYATHSRFFKKLFESAPRAVGMLVSLEDAENGIEEGFLQNLKDSIKRYKVGGGEFKFGSTVDTWGIQLPPQELREFGHLLSMVAYDNEIFSRDQVVRRTVLNYAGENTITLFLANILRADKNLPPMGPSNFWGSYYVREYDATYSLFRYGDSGIEDNTSRIKIIPYHKVVTGAIDQRVFQNKVVLIGPKYLSSTDDYVLSPFSKEEYRTPKINIHALVVSALADGKTVYALPKGLSIAFAVLMAIFLSIVISRVQPARGLLITVATMLGILVLSFIAFTFLGIWVYVTHIVLTIFVVYYIWVPFRAIAEYQTRYAIEEETKILKEVDRLKQNFISLMSHDLKTPVAKIAGMSDALLRNTSVSQEEKRILESIKDATIELNSFITSILDLTKVESRKLDLKRISKDINEIIKTVVQKLKYEIQRNEMSLDLSLGTLYPVTIDVDLISRVVSNLIENAIKYAGQGKTIRVKSWDDESWVYVEIADNGLGIKEEDLGHVFDKFYRVKNDKSHSVKGTGLGLYLVKYFIELHQGTISVVSRYNEGTSFIIKLPNS